MSFLFKYSRRVTIATTVILLGGVLVYWVYAKFDPPDFLSAPAAVSSVRGTEDVLAQTSSIDDPQREYLRNPRPRSLVDPNSPSEKLARLYLTTTDRRSFYDVAVTQPEAGGIFYAAKTRMECMAWVANGKTNSVWLSQRLAAIPAEYPARKRIEDSLRRLHEPCFGFDDKPVPYSTFKSLADAGKRDPLSSTLDRLHAALDSESAKSASEGMQAILGETARSQNAHLMYEVMHMVGIANSAQMVVIIDGKALHPAYWDAFALALPAATCAMGAECSANASGLTNFCARGRCFDNLFAYARGSLNDAQYTQFIQFYNIATTAIITADFSNFSVLKIPKG